MHRDSSAAAVLERLPSSGTYDGMRLAFVALTSRESREWTMTSRSGKPRCYTDWSDALAGCDAVIHTAARAHVDARIRRSTPSRIPARNVDGTLGWRGKRRGEAFADSSS